MDLWKLLADIVVLLSASLLFGGLFSRLRLSPLIGYLVAGMLLGGPGSLHLVRSEREIEAIAELGVALLLFSLGLEFSIERLKLLGRRPLIGGALQIGATIVLAAIAAAFSQLSLREAVAFGMMISLSSTAVVLRLLMERSELEMPHGRNSLAVLLTQDLAVVPLAVAMSLLGGGGGALEVAASLGRMVLMAALLIVGLYLLTLAAVKALGMLTFRSNRELTVIFAVVAGLGSTGAAHAAGLSPALGAFVAGMLLGSSPFATQIRADVSSLRVVLLTLFFSSAGMVADPLWIAENWWLVGGVTLVAMLGKFGLTWVIFQLLGQPLRVASATGLCLAQFGEFAFVLGSIGRASGVVSAELYALVVSITITSFIASAFLVPRAATLGNRLSVVLGSRGETPGAVTTSPPADVLVIGFGPAGRIAARPFVDKGKQVAIVDMNVDGVHEARRLGFHAEVGDATHPDVLEHAGLQHCKAVVITVPHYRETLNILEYVREQAPHVHVIVRSRYERHTEEFRRAGAHVVVGDEVEVGNSLARQVRDWLTAADQTPPEPPTAG